VRLDLMSWPEVETYLTERNDIVVPIGSTEQHGPNGLVGTDALCAEVIGRAVAEKAGAIAAPTLSLGMAQHHLGFPGTISLRPSTLMALVGDVIASLARHGFKKILFVNGHGGNIATVNATFAEYYAVASFAVGGNETPVECRLRNWWEAPAVAPISRELYGGAEGMHATPSEVSVTQFAFPDHIKRAEMHPEVAPTSGFTDAADFRRRYPDGRIGSDPSLADPAHGERLYRAAVAALSEDYRKFLAEP
jgi:creatinine amidohydrolase